MGALRTPLAWLLVVLCTALAGLAAACRGTGAEAAAPSRPAVGPGPGAAAPGSASPASSLSPSGSGAELRVRRGSLRPRLLLTGELAAAKAELLTAPATPSFQLTIRWIAEDGTRVAAGQPVVSFDNSTFVSQLEEKRRTAVEARSELLRLTAEGERTVEEKGFAVEQKRADLEKASTAAAVPAELMPRREYQDNQLKKIQAEAELAKAELDLRSARQGGAADVAVQRLALEKAEHEIHTAESAVDRLTLRAPRAGIVLAAPHPWEGRKVQEGDLVWIGMVVATLPELSSMEVEAALSDVDDGRVAAGMEATCILDAYPGESFRARVVEVSPVAREADRNPLLRYFPVRLQLLRRDPRRMRPGMSVRVEVEEPPAPDALVVPRAALDLAVRPPRALLASGGSVPVRLGPCTAFDCAVTPVAGGLAPGQLLRALTPAATPPKPEADPRAAAPEARR